MSRILGPSAWNYRKSSFRNSRCTTLGARLNRCYRQICTSNLDQSVSLGRAAGLPAGGGRGGSPPFCRPRLATTYGSRLWSSELPAPLGSAECLPTASELVAAELVWRLVPQMQLSPQVVGLPVRQGPEARARGYEAASTVWRICICQV
eukprot:220370-Pyramimonas_sp.AAC.1